jgi:molecular chaperone HscA
VDADRLLMATRSALQIDGDVLSTQERAAIDELMTRLSQCLQDPDQVSAAVVEASTKALADGTEAFAAQRMNRGIQQALAGRRVQDI